MMKSLRRYVRIWAPALAVLCALSFAGYRYRAELSSWFSVIDFPRRELASGADSQSASMPRIEVADAEEDHVHKDLGDIAYYTCPMHPTVHSDDPNAPCPICNMALEPVMKGQEIVRPDGGNEAEQAHDHGKPGDVAYYTCSMHSSVRSQDPDGTCPICAMNLIPVTREEVDSGMIVVDAARRQLIGVKMGLVERGPLNLTIRTVGSVVYDETRLTDVTLKFDGWIGELNADSTGKYVEEGSLLFTIYSPELLSAQDEYLEALRQSKSNPARGTRLLDAVRRRLTLWGITASDLDRLEARGTAQEYMPVLSPASGTIIAKNIVKGSHIRTGELLYRIADLSSVWIEADLYEQDLALVEPGQEARITLPYDPNQDFTGSVSYIYPYLNASTRTGKIRIEIPNPDGALKPAMYANVELLIPLGERLYVPESAVIYAGESRIAFVDRGEGRLQPRKLKTGVRNRDYIEVLEGLEEGEIVVIAANFLIAAESKLKAGIDRW